MTKVGDFSEHGLVFKEKPTVHNFNDIEGQKFGRLTVLGFMGDRKWLCKCDCGNQKAIAARHFKNGSTTSCGCHRIKRIKESNTTHGHTVGREVSRVYNIWLAMMQRCYDMNCKAYYNYGGRGITVCERWMKFENFLADMGEPSPGMSIDRKNNNEGYCYENCRWTTSKEQANNRRSNHLLTFKGKTQTIAQWAEETGINRATIESRINKYGWTPEQALTKKL